MSIHDKLLIALGHNELRLFLCSCFFATPQMVLAPRENVKVAGFSNKRGQTAVVILVFIKVAQNVKVIEIQTNTTTTKKNNHKQQPHHTSPHLTSPRHTSPYHTTPPTTYHIPQHGKQCSDDTF